MLSFFWGGVCIKILNVATVALVAFICLHMIAKYPTYFAMDVSRSGVSNFQRCESTVCVLEMGQGLWGWRTVFVR